MECTALMNTLEKSEVNNLRVLFKNPGKAGQKQSQSKKGKMEPETDKT